MQLTRSSAFFLLALLAFPADDSSAAESKRPNVVLVFIDDMGWGDFSCFGGTTVETKNIDRMASEGIRFEQFYVNSPICSPSRTAISTGHYPQRWRITSYLNNRQSNLQRGVAQWLDPAAPMLARSLHDAGYATGHFGKWHMGGQRDVGEAPLITEYGFDESLTNFEGLGPRVLPLKDAYDGKPPQKHGLGSDKLGRGPILWEDRSTITEAFVESATEFIKWADAKDQPFYVNVWPDDVHSPYFPPQARRGSGERRELYYAVLKTMDEQLGVLFDLIRNSDSLRDNTLVLICSDNGPDINAGTAGPFRGLKATLYEGGIRSPLIVWGPGLVDKRSAGSTNDQSILSAVDLVPSVLKITGTAAPVGIRYDGEELVSTLLGVESESRESPIFFRRPPDREEAYGLSSLPDLAVRDGKWKFLCEYDGSGAQLYDLTNDLGESDNVAAANADVVGGLTARLLEWHKSMPPDNGATFKSKQKRKRK